MDTKKPVTDSSFFEIGEDVFMGEVTYADITNQIPERQDLSK